VQEITLSPSDFVAVLNQTLEYAYPAVTIVGELANLRVSKNKWVYFDLKDEFASIKYFGTVYQLPGPLEDGLMLQVQGSPRLHPLFGFSVNVVSMQAVGEGSLRRAAVLLEAKLRSEGLFDESRKRPLLFPPRRIGLITSTQSAAYADFMKILNDRWSGIDICVYDVQVQGIQAPAQIVNAIEHFNTHPELTDVIVIVRGGGSQDDLAAYSTEQVTRAVASSRIVTMVAIGHEIDLSLAELAADKRASTPSNAAQLLVPDKVDVLSQLRVVGREMHRLVGEKIAAQRNAYGELYRDLDELVRYHLDQQRNNLIHKKQLLVALDPKLALRRGYVIVRQEGKMVRSGTQMHKNDLVDLELHDSYAAATVKSVRLKSDT
jgi:exodeoxyribonuclease VII large subunit